MDQAKPDTDPICPLCGRPIPPAARQSLHRMVAGQHHHVSPQYLHQYANHAAWLEDNRRSDNGELAHRLVSNAMDAPVSRNWKGYWQRAA